MPLDPSIILGAKPVQIDMAQFSPLNAFTTAMKLRQLEQEGELNALTLGERKGLKTFLAEDPDLSKPETRYALATRFGESGRKLSEGVTNIGRAQTEEAKRRNDLVVSKSALYRDALIDVTDQRSAIKWLQTQQNDPDMVGSPVTKVSIMDAARSIPADPTGFAQWKQQASLGLGEYIKQNKPQFFQQDVGGTKQISSIGGLGGPATVVPGSVVTTTMTPAQKREADDAAIRNEQENKRLVLEGRRVNVSEENARRDAIRLKQEGDRLGLEGRRVVVLEEDAKQKKDPVFQQNMAAARAKGEAIAKGEVGAKQALPGVITNASIALSVIDDMIGKQAVKDASGKVIQAATAPHPGFKDAVGATWKPGFRFIPGTDASDFQSYQDQIEGAAFLSAFESLKGGGAISEKEGAKATAAKLRMKLAQSETEYVKAAREFQEVVRTGVENARQKFGAGGVPPATSGGAVFLGFE
jgi:hypothetical protein